jgi:two-component system KDP operon response regulator KdpE
MGSSQQVISAGPIIVDLTGHTVSRSGEEVKLTATEFKLLAYLAANAGRVLTHQAILTHVWDNTYAEHIEYLRVYIGQLRKKLEENPEQPEYILTEPGVGYRFMTGD